MSVARPALQRGRAEFWAAVGGGRLWHHSPHLWPWPSPTVVSRLLRPGVVPRAAAEAEGRCPCEALPPSSRAPSASLSGGAAGWGCSRPATSARHLRRPLLPRPLGVSTGGGGCSPGRELPLRPLSPVRRTGGRSWRSLPPRDPRSRSPRKAGAASPGATCQRWGLSPPFSPRRGLLGVRPPPVGCESLLSHLRPDLPPAGDQEGLPRAPRIRLPGCCGCHPRGGPSPQFRRLVASRQKARDHRWRRAGAPAE